MRWESLGDGGGGILLCCCAARERGDSRGKGSTAAARVCVAIRQTSGPFICLAPLFTTVCTHLGDTVNMYLPTARPPAAIVAFSSCGCPDVLSPGIFV